MRGVLEELVFSSFECARPTLVSYKALVAVHHFDLTVSLEQNVKPLWQGSMLLGPRDHVFERTHHGAGTISQLNQMSHSPAMSEIDIVVMSA